MRKVVRYGGRAGEALNVDEPPGDPYSQYEALLAGERDPSNKYHPFKTEMDWMIASWATTMITSTALTALLKIAGVSSICFGIVECTLTGVGRLSTR